MTAPTLIVVAGPPSSGDTTDGYAPGLDAILTFINGPGREQPYSGS
ncbi:hypothetical protein [Hamadaea tsunoensis]|nr:hypothetical protein [Hamadaea tsunoensis]